MNVTFVDLVQIAGSAILVTFLWAAAVAYTYWDASHRRLPPNRVLLWLLIVALLPLVGFVAYIVSKVAGGVREVKEDHGALAGRRETPLKRPAIQLSPTSTLLASERAGVAQES